MDISTLLDNDYLYQVEHGKEELCLNNLTDKEAIKTKEMVDEIAANAADEEKFVYAILIFTKLKTLPEKTRVDEYPASENKTDEDILEDLMMHLRIADSEKPQQ